MVSDYTNRQSVINGVNDAKKKIGMVLYNINKSVRLYYKEEIHLADGCSSPGS